MKSNTGFCSCFYYLLNPSRLPDTCATPLLLCENLLECEDVVEVHCSCMRLHWINSTDKFESSFLVVLARDSTPKPTAHAPFVLIEIDPSYIPLRSSRGTIGSSNIRFSVPVLTAISYGQREIDWPLALLGPMNLPQLDCERLSRGEAYPVSRFSS